MIVLGSPEAADRDEERGVGGLLPEGVEVLLPVDGEAEGGPAELTTEQRYRRRVVAKVRVEVRDVLLAKPSDQDRSHRQVRQVAQETALRSPAHGQRDGEGTGEGSRAPDRLGHQG